MCVTGTAFLPWCPAPSSWPSFMRAALRVRLINDLRQPLQTCVWDVSSRELRAECFIQMGEMGKAISDLKAASKLKSDNTEAFYRLSSIYYQLGDHEMSLE